MKIVRRLLIIVGAAVVVAGAATAAAFLPAVQRWAFLRVAARWPGTRVTVGRVVLRPGSCTLREVRLTQPGVSVEAAAVAADLSLWEALVHRRLRIRDLTVTGLHLDLADAPSGPPAAGGGGAAPAFDGILRHLQPPGAIAIAKCRIEADLGFARTAERPGRHLRISLTGGHLAPGEEAQFDFEAAVVEEGPGRPLDAIEGRGLLTAVLDRESRFERISARLAATARGPLLRQPARLEVDATVARKDGGESYALALRSPETGAEGRLLDLAGAFPAGAPGITGTWLVRASQRQLAPFALGAALPDFSAAGEGRFELLPGPRAARVAGRLAGDCNRLEALDPRLRAVGRLGATVDFDLEYSRAAVRVTRFALNLGGERPALSVEAPQPFSLDLRSGVLTASDPGRDLLRAGLEAVPLAWARPFVPGIEFGGGDLRGAVAASLHEGRLRMHTAAPLTIKGLTLAAAGRTVLPAADLRVEAGLERTPEGTRLLLDALAAETAAGDRIEARGELALGSEAPVAGTLRADFSAVLPELLAGYVPVGPVRGRGAVACTFGDGTARVDRLEAHLATAEGRPLADLVAETPFRFDRARGLAAAKPGESGGILRLDFGRLPLALFQPWCGRWRLQGELLPGRLRAEAQPAGLRVAAAAPLRVEQFSLDGPGGAWARDLALELEPAVTLADGGGVTASVAAVRVTAAGGIPVLSAHAETTFGAEAGARGAAGFEVSVPALAGQPVLGGVLPPSQGRLSGEVKFTFNHDLLGEGRITLNGLVSPATNEPLPVANLSFRAGWSEEGTVAVQAPLLIDRAGERSDLTVAATLRAGGGDRRLEAKISGQHFVVDDARALIRAFQRAPAGAAAADAGNGGPPPAAAPWAPLQGQVTIDLRSLVCDRNIEVTGLEGAIALEPGRIAAEKITGHLGPEGVLQAGGEVRFAAGAPAPFTARYDFQLRDCEIAPLFAVAGPGEPPALEGLFNVRSQAAGEGRTLGELLAHTRGDYVLQSRRGIFRALQLAPPAPRGSGIVGGAARLIDNLGEKVGSLVAYDAPTQELAGLLTSFPYDQLNARLSRDPARNLVIADFTLVSPIVRLQGSGTVAYEPGKGMFERPLQLQLTMGVMGKAEAMIARFKSPALAGERDELGFMKVRDPFAVAGTLGRPDAGALYAMLKPTLVQRIMP